MEIDDGTSWLLRLPLLLINMLRLHVTGGVLRGGRAVDGEAAVAVLDTAAGVWLDKHGIVTASSSSSRSNKVQQNEDPCLELMRRCRHAASYVGVCVCIYGGLRGDVLLDDFLIAENSPLHSDTETTSRRTNNNSSPFDLMSPNSKPQVLVKLHAYNAFCFSGEAAAVKDALLPPSTLHFHTKGNLRSFLRL